MVVTIDTDMNVTDPIYRFEWCFVLFFGGEGRGFSIFVQYHVGDSHVNCELNITKHCCKESTLSTQNKILKNKHYAFPSKT